VHAAAAIASALALLLAACTGTTGGAGPGSGSPDPSASSLTEDVATGLRGPWALAFLPDGSALLTVRDSAEVLRVRRGGAPQSVGTVPGVAHGGEGGLLGIAVSPTFAADRTAFVYLTTVTDNRVLRLRVELPGDGAASQAGGLTVEQAVLTGIPRAAIHNGGRIAFGPDGFLYVATGDAGDTRHSQDLGSLGGKILRITAQGEPAPGNPLRGSPLWSWGHRNVQGLAWDDRGRMFASEFGQSTWDELNLITGGGNYGWPQVEGIGADPDFIDPLVQWRTSDASASGIAVADDAVYLAALRGESLWRVPLLPTTAAAVVGEPERLLRATYGRLRAVEVDDSGHFWLLTSNTTRGTPRPGDDRVVVLDPAHLR
jgi:glucose/arabinose dehydrogenase